MFKKVLIVIVQYLNQNKEPFIELCPQINNYLNNILFSIINPNF